jgi:DNA mismatch repair protein MSH6
MPPKSRAPSSTPGPASLKKAGSASGQKSLLGFFSKTPTPTANGTSQPKSLPERSSPRKNLTSKFAAPARNSQLTPQPSSDAVAPDEDEEQDVVSASVKKASHSPSSAADKGLPSPVSADEGKVQGKSDVAEESKGQLTPSRKAKKVINYMESDSEGDDDDVFKPVPKRRGIMNGKTKRQEKKEPPRKKRKVSESADEDAYEHGGTEDDVSGKWLSL